MTCFTFPGKCGIRGSMGLVYPSDVAARATSALRSASKPTSPSDARPIPDRHSISRRVRELLRGRYDPSPRHCGIEAPRRSRLEPFDANGAHYKVDAQLMTS